MNKIIRFLPLAVMSIMMVQSCKKPLSTPSAASEFIKVTATDNECRLLSSIDSSAWADNVLNMQLDTALLTFNDYITTSDSVAATIHMTPPCPNPSNGFFIWNINTNRECKLKLVCVDTSYNIFYYNAYKLQGGPIEIGFDFRSATAFHKNNNYKMYFAFYTSRDSIFYSGYGNFRIQ